MVAIGVGLGLLALLVTGGARALRSTVQWLHAQPSYQIAFSDIALNPAPPPWIKSGQKGLLEHVRVQAGQPKSLAVLDVDLTKLERAFALHSPWVKAVAQVRRTYPRPGQPSLSVQLEYRWPVAEARISERQSIVIDEDGIVLPTDDIDRSAAGPLISLQGFASNRFWGALGADDDLSAPDSRVVAAAKLSGFFKRRQHSLPAGMASTGKSVIAIISGDARGLFAVTADKTYILWGDPPDSERPGDLSADQKWVMLRSWVESQGKEQIEHPDYLDFTRHGVRHNHMKGQASAATRAAVGDVDR
jgi:hypothetical protein